jgi:acyl dehydratase
VAAHAAAVRRRHVLLGILALAAAIALAVPWGTTPDHALAGASPAAGAAAGLTGHAVYVVQPGDTLRSIAQKLDPGGDPRLVMATLRVQNGGDPVRAGERLVVP